MNTKLLNFSMMRHQTHVFTQMLQLISHTRKKKKKDGLRWNIEIKMSVRYTIYWHAVNNIVIDLLRKEHKSKQR